MASKLGVFLKALWKRITYNKYSHHKYVEYLDAAGHAEHLKWEDVKGTMSYHDMKRENARRVDAQYKKEVDEFNSKVQNDKNILQKDLNQAYFNLLGRQEFSQKDLTTHKVILLSTLACLIMFCVEMFLKPGFVIKSIIKIIVFVSAILSLGNFRIKSLDKKHYKTIILLGLVVFFGILLGYQLIKNFIDLDIIRKSLMEKERVGRDNFLYVTIYISLVNSFLEESFFRGFVFNSLMDNATKSFAYVFSSLLFALYHFAIMGTWFSPVILLLLLTGLFVTGVIFDFLTEKFDSFLAPWFLHSMANLAINTIGMMILAMI